MDRQGGFSLFELIATIVVLAIMAGVGARILDHGVSTYDTVTRTVGINGRLNYAMERLTREIGATNYNGTGYDMAAMTATRLVFTKQDGVTVTIDGSSAPLLILAYDTPAVSATLTDDLSALTLTYLQADGVTAATGTTDVAFVVINLTLTNGTATFSRQRRVALRGRL